MSRLTRGVGRGRGSRNVIPARRQASISHKNWITPAANTPQASA